MPQQQVRKLRIGKRKTKAELKSTSSPRAVSKLVGEENLESVAETLTAEEVRELIDQGTSLNVENKKNTETEKRIKKLLLRNAEYIGWKKMEGASGSCQIKASSTTSISTVKLLQKLKDLGKQKLFGVVFNANVTAAKQYLGKEDIDEIAEVEKKEFGSVALKPR